MITRLCDSAGGVQAVDRVGGDLHRGLEAEREVGAARSLSIVFGTPTTSRPSSISRGRRRACPRRLIGISASTAGAASARTSPAALLLVNGFVREVPRIVPPR
jgi:hypothetical protein